MKFPTGKIKSQITVNLFEQHLAQALDELWQVSDIKESRTHHDFLFEWRLASSCVLHSFYAVDSLINYLAYHYFKDSNSDWYIEPEDRKYFNKDMEKKKKWQSRAFDERLKIVWKEKDFSRISKQGSKNLIELQRLRNNVSHGNPYTIILEHEFVQTDEDTVTGIIHSTYPDPSQKGFVGKEFNSPAYLNKNDSKKAVCLALEIIVYILNQAKGFHFTIKTFHGGMKEFWLDGTKPVDEIFKEFGVKLLSGAIHDHPLL